MAISLLAELNDACSILRSHPKEREGNFGSGYARRMGLQWSCETLHHQNDAWLFDFYLPPL